jgi:hypothetical protein
MEDTRTERPKCERRWKIRLVYTHYRFGRKFMLGHLVAIQFENILLIGSYELFGCDHKTVLRNITQSKECFKSFFTIFEEYDTGLKFYRID